MQTSQRRHEVIAVVSRLLQGSPALLLGLNLLRRPLIVRAASWWEGVSRTSVRGPAARRAGPKRAEQRPPLAQAIRLWRATHRKATWKSTVILRASAARNDYPAPVRSRRTFPQGDRTLESELPVIKSARFFAPR
jgi:hypothetical protein